MGTAVLSGQTSFDSTGDGLLKGAYRFRQVAVLNIDSNGNPTETEAAFGVITFSGTGTYTVTGSYVDNTISGGTQQLLTVASGTYAIGTNGFGEIASPIAPTTNAIFGSVAQGVFTGSDTEDGDVNDIFIAIPVGTPPTNSNFTTTYSVGLLDFTGGISAAIKNALFNLVPDGAGHLGSITLTGQAANQSNPNVALPLTQTVTGGTYSFATDGNATMNIPLPSGVTIVNALFTGGKSMYVSTDGNFVLGWSPNGYDIFFGVSAIKAGATNATYQGTYFTSALEDATASTGTNSYYGSTLSAAGNGTQIIHQRLESDYYGLTYDFVTDDYTQLSSNGTTSTPDATFEGYQYAFGDSGKAFVAIGTYGYYSLLVGTQAPVFTGSGVFLNPVGIFNAASYAPITASIAPGELLTLFGTGLAPAKTSLSAPPGAIPNSLGGVQVLMNGQPAPIYYVSPTQISAIVPYELSTEFVVIQINSSGQLSNSVTMFLTDALPGVFTQNATGVGDGAVLHNANSTLVTTSNPAQAGEYLQIYLTGLGAVTPTVADGALGPVSPLSYSDQYNSMQLSVYFDDFNNNVFPQGTVTFAGLAPNYAGLYQINVQVPTGIGPGDVYLEIITDDADVLDVTVPVGGTSGAVALPRAAGAHRGSPAPSRRPRAGSRLPARKVGPSQIGN